jgi:hypothetical protein
MVLDPDRYDGEITVDGTSAPVAFEASAGPDCRLVLKVDPVCSSTYMLACSGAGRPGQTARQFAQSGRSADGKTLASDTLYLGKHGSTVADGFLLELRTRGAQLESSVSAPVDRPFLRLWLRSFRSFRNPIVATSLGNLIVRGDASPSTEDDVSGSIAVEALSVSPDKDWRDKADGLLRHMHDGLAFAHGGRLQAPMLEFVEGKNRQTTFYAGISFTSELPVQHHLPYRNAARIAAPTPA